MSDLKIYEAMERALLASNRFVCTQARLTNFNKQ